MKAILLIGNKRLIQVVMAACAIRYFGSGRSKDERELWEHSVTTALIAEIVARRITSMVFSHSIPPRSSMT